VTDLANRYGAPSPLRRRVTIALVAAVAVVALGWLAWAAIYQSTPQVRSDLAGFDVVDEHTATATLTVVRHDTEVVAQCYLRAVSEDHSRVGEATVVVRDGAKQQDVEVTIRTERRATTVERLGCTAEGQPQRK